MKTIFYNENFITYFNVKIVISFSRPKFNIIRFQKENDKIDDYIKFHMENNKEKIKIAHTYQDELQSFEI